MDLFPLPTSSDGYTYALLVVHVCMRRALMHPSDTNMDHGVTRRLRELLHARGMPSIVRLDNNTEFSDRPWQGSCGCSAPSSGEHIRTIPKATG
jgi:hypothetical protein